MLDSLLLLTHLPLPGNLLFSLALSRMIRRHRLTLAAVPRLCEAVLENAIVIRRDNRPKNDNPRRRNSGNVGRPAKS